MTTPITFDETCDAYARLLEREGFVIYGRNPELPSQTYGSRPSSYFFYARVNPTTFELCYGYFQSTEFFDCMHAMPVKPSRKFGSMIIPVTRPGDQLTADFARQVARPRNRARHFDGYPTLDNAEPDSIKSGKYVPVTHLLFGKERSNKSWTQIIVGQPAPAPQPQPQIGA